MSDEILQLRDRVTRLEASTDSCICRNKGVQEKLDRTLERIETAVDGFAKGLAVLEERVGKHHRIDDKRHEVSDRLVGKLADDLIETRKQIDRLTPIVEKNAKHVDELIQLRYKAIGAIITAQIIVAALLWLLSQFRVIK